VRETGTRAPLSRETRLLLVTVVLSISALWLLARIRFADRPLPSNPITPVLTQLAPPPVFEQLTSALDASQARVASRLIAVTTRNASSTGGRGLETRSALRIDADTAVALLDETTIVREPDVGFPVSVIARDPASGLALLHFVSSGGAGDSTSPPPLFPQRRADPSGFLLAADVSPSGASARPVFVGAVETVVSPIWPAPVWKLPRHVDVSAGSFIFTTDGVLVGLTADTSAGLALVSAEAIGGAVESLRRDADRDYGDLGIEVQPLTADVASAAGAHVGVVATWVDPSGPAGGHLTATDVIEAVDDNWLFTTDHWRARASRLPVGQTIALRVRRRHEIVNVAVTAAARSAPVEPASLGLSMRSLPGAGLEIVAVTPTSAGARAGLRPGDIITLAGNRPMPTAAQLTRAFTAASREAIVVAVTRGETHLVLALEKR
jgi:S1-C subfamily serine protease